MFKSSLIFTEVDEVPIAEAAQPHALPKVIAPACTLKLVSTISPPSSPPPAENAIPKGSHWVDLTEPGSIVVIDQPEGQKCAAIGGIMAQRMRVKGVAGCVVGGRVRDMAELKGSQLPVSEPLLDLIRTRSALAFVHWVALDRKSC